MLHTNAEILPRSGTSASHTFHIASHIANKHQIDFENIIIHSFNSYSAVSSFSAANKNNSKKEKPPELYDNMLMVVRIHTFNRLLGRIVGKFTYRGLRQ